MPMERAMSDCLTQLDALLSLAETEYAALLKGDLDAVEHICAERDRLLAAVMIRTEEISADELYERLLTMKDIQQKLCKEAARQHEALRGQIFASKQESRRLNGYRKCVNMALP